MINSQLILAVMCLILSGTVLASHDPSFSSIEYCNKVSVGGGKWLENNTLESSSFVAKAILSTLAKETNIDVHYEQAAPFARQYFQLKNGQLDLLVGLYPTRERKEIFLLSKPYLNEALYVYSLNPQIAAIDKIDKLKGYSTAVIRGASYGEQIDSFNQINNSQLYYVKTQQQRQRMLETARIDYFIANEAAMLSIVPSQGSKLVKGRKPISHYQVVFALSKQSQCKQVLEKINAIIEG